MEVDSLQTTVSSEILQVVPQFFLNEIQLLASHVQAMFWVPEPCGDDATAVAPQHHIPFSKRTGDQVATCRNREAEKISIGNSHNKINFNTMSSGHTAETPLWLLQYTEV